MLEHWQSSALPCSLPQGQGDVRRKWKASVMIEDGTSRVHEYDVNPSKKIKLSEMLTVISQTLRELSDESTKDCGFKIW